MPSRHVRHVAGGRRCAPGRRRGGGRAPRARRRDRPSPRRPGTPRCRCRGLPSPRRRPCRSPADGRPAPPRTPALRATAAAAMSMSGVRIAVGHVVAVDHRAAVVEVEGGGRGQSGDRRRRRSSATPRSSARHATARYIAPVSTWRVVEGPRGRPGPRCPCPRPRGRRRRRSRASQPGSVTCAFGAHRPRAPRLRSSSWRSRRWPRSSRCPTSTRPRSSSAPPISPTACPDASPRWRAHTGHAHRPAADRDAARRGAGAALPAGARSRARCCSRPASTWTASTRPVWSAWPRISPPPATAWSPWRRPICGSSASRPRTPTSSKTPRAGSPRGPTWRPTARSASSGISFSGGLSIVAAGRPALRDSVAFVMSFGGHGDLIRVMRYLTLRAARRPPTPAPPRRHHRSRPRGSASAARLRRHRRAADLRRSRGSGRPGAAAARRHRASTCGPRRSRWSTRRWPTAEFARARDYAATLAEPARTLMTHVNDRAVDKLGPLLFPIVDGLDSHPSNAVAVAGARGRRRRRRCSCCTAPTTP